MQTMQGLCRSTGDLLKSRRVPSAGQWRSPAPHQLRMRVFATSRDALANTDTTQQRATHDDQLHRRAVLQAALFTAFVSPAVAQDVVPMEVAAPSWSRFVDDVDNFTITVPPGWSSGEGGIDGNTSFSGSSGTRRVVAWFPDPSTARDTNVTLVITNVGADFTGMGSFGTAYSFGSNLVGSMDQSYLKRASGWSRPKGPIQEARLLDAKEAGRFYEVEYTVFKEPEPKRHLLSYVTIGYNGRYNRLYTLTAQSTDENWAAVKPAIQKMISSFEPPIRNRFSANQ